MSLAGRLAPACVLTLLAACASSKPAPLAPLGAAPAALVVEEDGPWQEVGAGDMAPAGSVTARAPSRAPPARVPPRRPDVEAPRVVDLPDLRVPERRATPPPSEQPTPPTKSPEAMARERFLDHPTRVRAARITFYCPPEHAGLVRLTGARVRETAPGRRLAEGGARLLCRELTLEAETLVLRIRDDGIPDLQVTARGDVSFVTDQKGHVMHEDGIRGLVLTNDQVVPLR